MFTRRLAGLVGCLITVLILFACQHAGAATPAPTAPVPIGFCATIKHAGTPDFRASHVDYIGATWVFSGDDGCGVTPPPVDPGAYANAVVTWITYPSTPARSTDVRVFGNVFGRINSIEPAVGWDFAHGATVQLVDTSARYYRMHVSIPANAAPTNGHALKAVSYGKSPANLRAKFAIVATGAPWPTGDATGCYKPVWPFDDTSALTFAYHAVAGPYRCAVGNEFDVLVDAIGNGTMALSWQ